MAEDQKFETEIRCPTCGQMGFVAWKEGPDGGQERGGSRIFILASEGFHIEEGRMPSGEPIIVCNMCDEILPD